MGYESAFRFERKSKLDYIEVASPDEIIKALKQLRDDKELYRAMVENGKIRAKETDTGILIKRWRTFLIDIAAPAYERWCLAPEFRRKIFIMQRNFYSISEKMTEGIKKIIVSKLPKTASFLIRYIDWSRRIK